MATTSYTRHLTRPKPRHAFDPTQVRYSPRWVGAGAAVGAFAALSVWYVGVPAAAAFGAAGLASAAYATLLEPRRPVLERITVRVPDLPPALAGLRIGQLSDMHLGHPHAEANTRWAIEQIMAERPDMIALTGDFVSYASSIASLPELLSPLHAPLGVYAVPGNHDYFEGLETITAQLEPLGIEFLINTQRSLRWRGANFWLAGVDDLWEGEPDLDAALHGIPSDEFTLLLAHAPDVGDDAAQRNVNLQLSGHTHGGHLRLPWLGAFCLPFYGERYSIGHEQIGRMQLYVSRGLGGWPLRMNCPPEATILTLSPE